ncbi:trehalose-phosphatase [Actinomadura sp. KC345]|uniref:trehalose-phosphatase n=1 Tax=Actinomadura sp. KC345 TaxID=2530371 RepID=UPI0014053363|nr:trehalose-phosphatase [Actinomadura sp. KC345]
MPSINQALGMPNAPKGRFVNPGAAKKWADIVAHMEVSAVLSDLDGTWADEVPGNDMPDVHPDTPTVFGQLSERMLAAAVSGRDDRAIEEVYGIRHTKVHRISEYGCGYSYDGDYTDWVERPGGLDDFNQTLDLILKGIGVYDRVVTQKKPHLSCVHFQGVSDRGVVDILANCINLLAVQHGLTVRKGRGFIEVGPEVDKGNAIWRLFHERDIKPYGVVFLGNSSGDEPARKTLRYLEKWGVVTAFVCVGHDDRALAERSDIHLDRPDETRKLLTWLRDGTGRMMAS